MTLAPCPESLGGVGTAPAAGHSGSWCLLGQEAVGTRLRCPPEWGAVMLLLPAERGGVPSRGTSSGDMEVPQGLRGGCRYL